MKHGRLTPFLFLLPALGIYAVFVLLPIGESFRLSLFHWSSPLAKPRFCGLANFTDLMQDRVFWWALYHNALLVGLSLAIQLPVACGLALLLSRPIRGRGLLRTALFAPMVMPTAAIAALWLFIYQPGDGLLTQLIRIVRPDFDYGWLGVPSHAMFWVFITICWRYTGFHLVLFLAGISAIPTQLYEAARIDGAGEWSQARHITLPLLKPTLAVAATLSIIGSLKYFDLVYLMAAGVPEESRELLATYVYRLAFEGFSGRFGYGSAAAVSLLLVALAVVLPLQTRRRAATAEGA
ncbi:MAG: sugar ABC transporter permease [Victivallales bacterium]|nr:sugar ABC transporter permease [Victivallales bacterium]MBT7164762.1 sugar ABC transporter permease [Victivallales bacterium]